MAAGSPYGAEHRRRRALAVREAVNTPCPRCGLLMLPGQKLHFGHSRDVALEPGSKADQFEHADYEDCPAGGNTSAGGRLGAQIKNLRPSRRW